MPQVDGRCRHADSTTIDGGIDVLVPEDLGHLPELGDEDEGADLGEAFLEAIDELQHEARDIRHG